MTIIRITMGSLIWLCLIPFFTGIWMLGFFHRQDDGMAECMTVGYFVMFAVCQIIAVPMIFLKMPLSVFCRVLAAIYVFLAAAGLLKQRKWIVQMTGTWIRELCHHSWSVYAAVAAVFLQAYYYIPYIVTNEDDAYYVAAATTAVQTDTMYLFSPYTGRALQQFNLRYVLSPFPMFQAFLSKCIQVHPSTLAHTILAPVLVVLAYLVYVSLGKLLFSSETLMKNENWDSTEKRIGLFVLFLSMVNVTSFYCVRNQGSVLLVRIWQGKAVLAAILIPFLFYHCYRMVKHPKEKGSLWILLTASLGCCMVSSMGIALAVVLMGIFAILFGVLQKNRSYVTAMLIGCIPEVVYGVWYIGLKMK